MNTSDTCTHMIHWNSNDISPTRLSLSEWCRRVSVCVLCVMCGGHRARIYRRDSRDAPSSSVTAWHPMKTRVLYIYAYMLVGDIHYNSEREPYNMMHLWYANRGQNITLCRRRDSCPSPPGLDGDIPEFQHASIPPTLTPNRVIVTCIFISLEIVRAVAFNVRKQ